MDPAIYLQLILIFITSLYTDDQELSTPADQVIIYTCLLVQGNEVVALHLFLVLTVANILSLTPKRMQSPWPLSMDQ